MPIFSIVVPTYKRKKHVIHLLASLKKFITKQTEIILVEQVQNHKKEFLQKSKQEKLNVRYIFLPKASTPHAKNVGVQHAKGKYIVFFDDDVLLKTSITPFLRNFTKANIAAVNGRSVAKGQKEEPKRNDTGRITFLGHFTDGYSSIVPQEIETLIGCNMCWRKDIFLSLGGFDEEFCGNAIREEADLSLRAREKGYKLLFDPRVEVLHVRAESGGTRKTEGRIQWYFDFFSNETYFFLKHFSFFIVPMIILTRWEWALRCMFGFGREISTRSLTTPLFGVVDGYKKYWRYKYENRS